MSISGVSLIGDKTRCLWQTFTVCRRIQSWKSHLAHEGLGSGYTSCIAAHFGDSLTANLAVLLVVSLV